MTAFLRETWELWRWAFFSPKKLHERLNAWVPPESIVRHSSGSTRIEIDETSQQTSLHDILWARMIPGTRANRILAQYAILVAVSTLPLAIATLVLGGPRHMILTACALLASFVCGTVCASLGLATPLLSTWIYIYSPSAVGRWIDMLTMRLPPLHTIGSGMGIVVVSFGITGFLVDQLWRRGWRASGWLLMFSGVAGGLGWGLKVVTTTPKVAVFSTLLIVLALLTSHSDKPTQAPIGPRVSIATSITITIIATFLPIVGTKASDDSIAAVIAGTSCATLLTIAMTCTITFHLERLNPIGLTGSLWIAILVGLTGLPIVYFVASICFAYAQTSLAYPLTLSFIIGFTLAPTRTNEYITILAKDIFERARGLGSHTSPISPTARRTRDKASHLLSFGYLLCASMSLQHGLWTLLTVPAMLLGYTRLLPDMPMLTVKSFLRSRVAHRATRETLLQWLKSMPPHEFDLALLPVPRHVEIIIRSFHADPWCTLNFIDRSIKISPSWGYRQTLIMASRRLREEAQKLNDDVRAKLIVRRLLELDKVEHIVALGDGSIDMHLALLAPQLYSGEQSTSGDSPAVQRDLLELVSAIKKVASSVKVALNEDLPIQRERGLERAIGQLQQLRDGIPALDLDEAGRTGWLHVLQHWQSILRNVIEAQLTVGSSEIIQPFQSGNPVRADRPHLFKGRKSLAASIVRAVTSQGRPTLVLHGPRRCGKSSFLLNLSRLLPDDLFPIYVDLQSQAMTSSEGDFCYGLVRAATRDLRSRGVEAPAAVRTSFQTNPYPALEDWLDALRPILADRRLLFCLDEFEKLGEARERGNVGPALFDELRHLIQHRAELGFVFCGAQTLEELGPQWTNYFINARPVEILYLEREEARELLLEPDPSFNLSYEEEVIDRVLDMTSCQPYLVQLLGEAMVKAANRHGVRRIDPTLLEEAVVDALALGTIYFANQWEETTGMSADEVAAGQAVLLAVAEGGALPAADKLTLSALSRLQRYHVISEADGYQFEIPLVARWIRERKVTRSTQMVSQGSAA